MLRGLLLFLLFAPSVLAAEKPRLVVLVFFDQMRGDYLGRWYDLYTDGGFRRLTTDGTWFHNCHYPYAYTITGPGHATVSTGCPPAVHGIIANEWHDRKLGATVNCVGSDRHEQIPLPIWEKDDKKRTKNGVSPERLLAPTLADAMKEQLGDDVRVVCLSLKDRSSALPGGKRPDACYWVDKNGRVATSTYYRDTLHPWVKEFNQSAYVEQWHGKAWHRLHEGLDYRQRSGPDEVKGEGKGEDQGLTFPHVFGDGPKKKRTNYYAAVANSPCGNELLLALAKKAIDAERLGQHDKPDFLSISFSSNDMVGHAWGPDSQEVLDMTLRSDLIVKELLSYLDEKVGKGKYVVALTADHGICPLPELSRGKGLPARRVNPDRLQKQAEEILEGLFPPPGMQPAGKGKWIEASKSNMYYLDRKRMAARGVTAVKVEAALAEWLRKQPGMGEVRTRLDLAQNEPPGEFGAALKLSYVADRSGDVMLLPQKYCLLTTNLTGTSHGSPWPYDTHVPLVVMGPGIKADRRIDRVSPEHTAVILARALGIKPPAKARVTVPKGVFVR